MKKFMMGAAAFALALAIGGSVFAGGSVTAEAAVKKSSKKYTVHCNYSTGEACRFVDKDKDGICDYCDGEKNGNFVDKNNDGICDNHSKHNENCVYYGQNVTNKTSNGHHSGGHGHGRHH